MNTYRIRITAPGFAFGRLGTARPAFSRGRYHVQLDGDRKDYAFEDGEFEVVRGSQEAVTTAELIRYNIARLVAEQHPDQTAAENAVALAAWPLAPDLSEAARKDAIEIRRRRLQRIMASSTRVSAANLDDLARALEVEPAEFLRQPSN